MHRLFRLRAIYSCGSQNGDRLLLHICGRSLVAGKQNRLAGWTQALFEVLLAVLADQAQLSST
jgi:hypothetical protein